MTGLTPHPMAPGVIEIDDSRLRTMWMRHHQRALLPVYAMWTVAIAAALVAVAMVIWAISLWYQKPPVVNVAGPTVNIPKQDPPVVNVTPNITVQPAPVPNVNVYPNITVPPPAPQAAPLLPQVAPPTSGPQNKVVTEFTVFQTVTVDGYPVQTGWKYHNSNDAAPYTQYCLVIMSPTRKLELATDGAIDTDLAQQVSDVGLSYADALRYATSCTWFR